MFHVSDHVFLVSRRWDHHAGHSGYDRLSQFIGRHLTTEPIPDILLPDRILWKLNRDMLGYDRTSVALELHTLQHMAIHKNCIYHFLYGESAYKYLAAFNGWRGHRLVATYHKPPRAFAEMIRDFRPLKKLSGVIVVGRNQLTSFKDVLPEKNIFFVPHPVDTEFFSPPSNFHDREQNLCLFVGAHLRDYVTLRSVIEESWMVAPHIKFAIVIHPLKVNELSGVEGNYQVYENISESELLRLYRKASLLIMPLRDTTANNTVLEAMACGLPSVVTDVGAIRDYLNDDCARFISPFDYKGMVLALIELLASTAERERMGLAARARSLSYDWRVIAQQMDDVYTQIASLNKDSLQFRSHTRFLP